MKKLRFLFCFQFLFVLTMNAQDKAATNEKSSEKKECIRTATFGDIAYCLPKIEGMVECYLEPDIKELADEFEVAENSVIGYYLTSDAFAKRDSANYVHKDDYFKVYGTNAISTTEMGERELEQFSSFVAQNFIGENWDELKTKITEDHDYLSIGKPVKVDAYPLTKKANSIVLLTKYQLPDTEYVLVININAILIHKRLIWLAYYKHYEGEESIEAAKTKNDQVVLKVLEANRGD